MLVAHLPETLQELRRSGDVTSLAEDGLDEDGGGVARGGLLREEEGELGEAVVGEVCA